MRDQLQQAFASMALFLPKLVGFLLILIIGVLVAKAIAKLVDGVLERVGFDRAVERGGVKTALARSQYDASDLVSKVVYYALLLFVLQMAFGVFGPNPISELLLSVIAFLPKIIVAIVIVVVAAAIAAAVRDLITNALSGLSYGRLLGNLASTVIIGLGIIAALNQIEVATNVTNGLLTAVLATVAGILIVGVGGGLIKPMQHRWERYLSTAEAETENIRRQRAATASATSTGAASTATAGEPTGGVTEPTGGATGMTPPRT